MVKGRARLVTYAANKNRTRPAPKVIHRFMNCVDFDRISNLSSCTMAFDVSSLVRLQVCTPIRRNDDICLPFDAWMHDGFFGLPTTKESKEC